MTLGLIGICVFAPLLAAIASFTYRKNAYFLVLITSLLVVTAITFLTFLLHRDGSFIVALGGWVAPLGIQWRVDGFASLMLLITSIIAIAITLYAKDYFHREEQRQSFWPLWMILLAGLNALFLSNDLFNWYVTLELIGISAVALVTLANSSRADRAAFRYLLVSLLGSLCFLAGVALLYRAYGVLDIFLLEKVVTQNLNTTISLSLILAGLLLKSAIFPLHFWLAPAHSNAPAPVSALLSALVVKGSFYIILRIWFAISPEISSNLVAIGLSTIGIFAIFWGSLCALRTQRLKLLVAYSTVAQLGYFMLFFLLSMHAEIRQVAFGGVVYFIISHALAKSALFLGAGNIQKLAGHDKINQLQPFATQLPMTMFAFALAGASIMGLPPSGGFIAKWTVLNAALVSDQWYLVIVLIGGGLLSAAYIFRILKLAFHSQSSLDFYKTNSVISPTMQWVPLVLAMAAIALGFNAIPTLSLLEISSPFDYLHTNGESS